jgi:hypothetical protein
VIIDTYYYGPISSGVEVSISWAFGGAAGYQGRQGAAGSGGGGGGQGFEVNDTTYSDLLSVLGTTGLTGGLYRITDFATTGWVLGSSGFNGATYSAALGATSFQGGPEQLIVQAINDGTTSWIDPLAKSEDYPLDIIYYTWEIDSTDAAYYDPVGLTAPGYKGTIYYREDTYRKISGTYDWRNFKFLRWSVKSDPAYVNEESYVVGDQVSYAGSNYVFIKNSSFDNILPMYDDLTNNFIHPDFGDYVAAKDYWLRLGPHEPVPFLSPLIPLYANDSFNSWTTPFLTWAATWSFRLGQGATAAPYQDTSEPIYANLELETGYIVDTFYDYIGLSVADPIHINSVNLGGRDLSPSSTLMTDTQGKAYYSNASDNVFILGQPSPWAAEINNLDLSSFCLSNTFIVTPPTAGGESSHTARPFDFSNNRLSVFSGNTVWLNYTNVTGNSGETGNPLIEKLFNIFYGNKIDTAVGNLFLDGLINSDIKSIKSSIIETCENLHIKGDLSLILEGGNFFPWNTTGPDPLSTENSFGIPGVWTSPYNYNSHNLIRVSKNISLNSPVLLYLSAGLNISGTMQASHLSGIQNSEFLNMAYSAFILPTQGDGLHRNNHIGKVSTTYVSGVASSNRIGTLANTSFYYLERNVVSGSMSQMVFTGEFSNNSILDMNGCTGSDFVWNVVPLQITDTDFTASVLQATNVTKYHFTDLFGGASKLYYFNNGTMNVTDSDF